MRHEPIDDDKRRPTRRRRLASAGLVAAALVVVSLVATACGNDDDNSEGAPENTPVIQDDGDDAAQVETPTPPPDEPSTPVPDPEPDNSEPEEAGEPAEPDAAMASVDQTQLDSLVTRTADEFGLPGMLVQVRVDGRVPTTAVAGVADLETGEPLAHTDQIRIYSVTKAVTSHVMLQLAEEGVLTVDDLVTDWLPASVVGAVPNNASMTIRQLLNHSAGVADHLDGINAGDPMPPFIAELFAQGEAGEYRWYTPQDLIEFSTRFDPPFAPGEGAVYSNTGYIIAGLIIEAATGNSLGDEMAARVFQPLGLDGTYLETEATPNDYVVGYQQVPGGDLLDLTGSNASFGWAAGGLISTIEDLGRLAEAIFTGELLTADSHAEMFTTVPDSNREGINWGLGVVRIETPGGNIDVISGGAAGYTAIGLRFAEQNTTIVAIANRDSADPAFEALAEAALAL